MGRTLPLHLGPTKGRNRRILPTKVRPGKRRLTEPTAAAQPGQVPLGVVEAPQSDGSANFARSGS
jgi:hypothetical protein